MRLILAIILPFVIFSQLDNSFTESFVWLLQVTLIGWLPTAIWAAYSLGQFKTDKKIREALESSK